MEDKKTRVLLAEDQALFAQSLQVFLSNYAKDDIEVIGIAANGQIATQYVDFEGNATDDIQFNPNDSAYAIEGITSPDGRVFGKMGHSERFTDGLFRNIAGNKDQKLFMSGVNYFKWVMNN